MDDKLCSDECTKHLEELAIYKRFFDECPVGLYKTRNSDGLFLDINQTGAEMLGYNNPEEVIGKVCSTELYDPNLRKKLLSMLKKKGRVGNFEVELCRKDGTCIWVSASASNGDERLIGSLEDISDRKKLENEIEDLRSQLLVSLRDVETKAKKRLEAFMTESAKFA